MMFVLLVTACSPRQAGAPTEEHGAVVEDSAGPRLALVIGVGTYDDRDITDLTNPIRDADLIAASLRQVGFELPVPVMHNPTREQIWNALTQFSRALEDSGDEAVGLIYFAGHGVQVHGVNYLLARDARRPRELPTSADAVRRTLSAAFIPADEMLALMGERPGGASILILDACRDNPLTRSLGRATRSTGATQQGLGQMEYSAGSLIAYATRPNQLSLDGDGQPNSPYATALAEEILRPGNAADVFARVRTRVRNATGQAQVPIELNGLEVPLCFASCGSGVQVAALEPAAAQPTQIGATLPPAQTPVQESVPAPPVSASVLPDMVRIPGRNFEVGRYEVTFAQWDACVAAGGCNGYRPADGDWGRGSRPVINVSWDDAQAYVQWLSQHTGQRYRLLTAAEWEYAARAGSTTHFSWGDQDPVCDQRARNGANFQACTDHRTRPVGSFRPNGFGLYDVHGNVWEWVEDGEEGSRRVLRGGSYVNYPDNDRSTASRGATLPTHRLSNSGFRVARTL